MRAGWDVHVSPCPWLSGIKANGAIADATLMTAVNLKTLSASLTRTGQRGRPRDADTSQPQGTGSGDACGARTSGRHLRREAESTELWSPDGLCVNTRGRSMPSILWDREKVRASLVQNAKPKMGSYRSVIEVRFSCGGNLDVGKGRSDWTTPPFHRKQSRAVSATTR